MPAAHRLELIALPGIPAVRQGDDLAALIRVGLRAAGLQLESGDVLVLAQKIVSKSEGRMIELASVQPGPQALALAEQTGKDPRLVELILGESARVVRAARDVLIVEHRLGYIMANAGIDQSNVADPSTGALALLLPKDPDGSAERLRRALQPDCDGALGVIINDSFGRPWRMGTVGVAIGCAGVAAVKDLRGTSDLFGRTLQVTVVGHADEIAAAASLVMGQASEGHPIVLVRGLPPSAPHSPASALLRPPRENLFK